MEQPGAIETGERSFALKTSLALLAAVVVLGPIFVTDTES
jgi:hypothetical protein